MSVLAAPVGGLVATLAGSFQLIPFEELDAIEFESELKQLGVSETYEFRVRSVVLHRRDGTTLALSKEILSEEHPILWPQSSRAKFPEGTGSRRVDRMTVMLQARTRVGSEASEFVFVMPRPVTTANQAVLRKQRDAFPQRIQFASPATPRTASAK